MLSKRAPLNQTAKTNNPNRRLRDVVALAVLPAMWSGANPTRTAESLAAALFTSLAADFIYVCLVPGGGHAPLSVAQTDRYSTDAMLAARHGPKIHDWSRSHDPEELLLLPNPKGPGTIRVSAYALGLNAELGVVAAGFLNDESPTEFDQLLLSVGASQAATATNNIGLIQSLEQRTAQFQTLFHQSPLGIFLVDCDFRIREINPVALGAFDKMPGVLIGRDFDEILHVLWDDRFADEIAKIFRRTLKTGEPYSTLQHAEKRRDRDAIESYEWRGDRITLSDGGFGVLCHFRDISAEALARLKTAESDERFRALVTASTDVVYSMSPDWREMRHLDGSDFIPDTTEPSQDWVEQYLHPDDKNAVMERIADAIRTESLFEMEHRVLRVDGSVGGRIPGRYRFAIQTERYASGLAQRAT